MDEDVKQQLHEGTVIPAHPLALDKKRQLDEQRQRALTRYYIESGAGGIAVAVHTTQFEIRDAGIDLFESVLQLAVEEVERAQLERPFIKVAGICGPTDQAVREAQIARDYGYDLGLLSPGGLNDWSESELLERAEAVAEVIPLFGFYLQPAVGGRVLSFDFWKKFSEILNVKAIKIAPFDRYQTINVARAVCESSRSHDIALYTGNDDNIVSDLLMTFRFKVGGKSIEKSIVGGLLGHWAVWTQKAVELLGEIKKEKANGYLSSELLQLGEEVTDSNSAVFDSNHNFKGSIAGVNEVLRRQGLLNSRMCLNPEEELQPGQMEEIRRVYQSYPHLNDDDFVQENLHRWLS